MLFLTTNKEIVWVAIERQYWQPFCSDSSSFPTNSLLLHCCAGWLEWLARGIYTCAVQSQRLQLCQLFHTKTQFQEKCRLSTCRPPSLVSPTLPLGRGTKAAQLCTIQWWDALQEMQATTWSLNKKKTFQLHIFLFQYESRRAYFTISISPHLTLKRKHASAGWLGLTRILIPAFFSILTGLPLSFAVNGKLSLFLSNLIV